MVLLHICKLEDIRHMCCVAQTLFSWLECRYNVKSVVLGARTSGSNTMCYRLTSCSDLGGLGFLLTPSVVGLIVPSEKVEV